MKIIYLGTPHFAVPPLIKLNSTHNIVGVVTKLDKPVGRSKTPVFSPVKQFALEHELPVFQFEKLNSEAAEILKSLNADIMITCAFGQILSSAILNATPHGVYNIHGSILPKYRGASPIQSAIINGERETGISILKSDEGIDSGDVLLTKTLAIKEYETYGELAKRLSHLASEVIVEGLHLIENNKATLTPQNHEHATVCKTFKKDAGALDFNKTAKEVVNLIHGLNPSPLAFFIENDIKYKVYRAKVVTAEELEKLNITSLNEYKNGEVIMAQPKRGLIIKCKDRCISILEIQAENAKIMDIKSFLNGKGFKERVVL